MHIPKDLLKEAVEISGAKSQTVAVILGLQELIRKKKLEELASLRGSGIVKRTQRELRRQRAR